MQQPPTFPPKKTSATSLTESSSTVGMGSTSQSNGASDVGRALVDRADGVSMPALLGYLTSCVIFLFGAVGTLFSDMPGEIKKGMFGGYAAGSIVLILLSSFVDSHHKISQRLK